MSLTLKCIFQEQMYSFVGISLNGGIHPSCILIWICVNIVSTFTNKALEGLILKSDMLSLMLVVQLFWKLWSPVKKVTVSGLYIYEQL